MSIARRTGLRFGGGGGGGKAMPRCLVESTVKGFRVRYNSAVLVAEEEKDLVKIEIEAAFDRVMVE